MPECHLCGREEADVQTFDAYGPALRVPQGMNAREAEARLVFYINIHRMRQEPPPTPIEDDDDIQLTLPDDLLTGMPRLCADCASKIPWDLIYS